VKAVTNALATMKPQEIAVLKSLLVMFQKLVEAQAVTKATTADVVQSFGEWGGFRGRL
jgi:hypothetical protein